MRQVVPFLVCALFVSVSALPFLAAPAEAAKAVSEGKLPGPRVGSQSARIGTHIYVVGGRNAGTYLDEIVDYDTTTGTSQVVGHLPVATGATNGGRQSTAVATDGRYIWVFGGAVLVNAGDLNGDGKPDFVPQSTADIIQFDPQTGTASTLTLDKLSYPVWGASAAYVPDACSGHGCFFIFGGFQFSITDTQNIKRHDTIDVFDFTKLTGTRVSQVFSKLPYAVQDAPAVYDANTRFTYLFGGLGDNNNQTLTCPVVNGAPIKACPTDQIVEFSVDSQSSSVVPGARLPNAVQYTTAAELSNRIYVLGGRFLDGTATGAISVFTPQSNRVETIPPTLPGGRFGASAVSDGTFIRIPGGRDAGPNKVGFGDVLKFIATPTEPWAPSDVTLRADSADVNVSWQPPVYDGG
ncbi:MAG: Kelch repeat-containing protein, partial [Thermoplasmatota archaeon]